MADYLKGPQHHGSFGKMMVNSRVKRGHLTAYLTDIWRKIHGHLAARCREQAATGLPAAVGG
jgi:hypothetical protein